MAKKRNTLVQAIVDQANAFFIASNNDQVQARKAIKDFVTALLIESNTYRGFNYLRRNDVPQGHTWGITFDTENSNHSYPDDSRIKLY